MPPPLPSHSSPNHRPTFPPPPPSTFPARSSPQAEEEEKKKKKKQAETKSIHTYLAWRVAHFAVLTLTWPSTTTAHTFARCPTFAPPTTLRARSFPHLPLCVRCCARCSIFTPVIFACLPLLPLPRCCAFENMAAGGKKAHVLKRWADWTGCGLCARAYARVFMIFAAWRHHHQ